VERLCAALAESEAQAEAMRVRLAQPAAAATPGNTGEAEDIRQKEASQLEDACSRVRELRELCLRTLRVLNAGELKPSESTVEGSLQRLQAELQDSREAASAVHAAAERFAEDRRQLAAKLHELEHELANNKAARTEVAGRSASSSPVDERKPAAPSQVAVQNGRQVEQQVAQALRDMRVHAEQQLAWVVEQLSKQAELQRLRAAAGPPMESVSARV